MLRLLGHGDAVSRTDYWIRDTREYGHVNEMTVHGLRRALKGGGFGVVHALIDPDVLRVGHDHHVTRDLAALPAMRLAGRLAALRPLRLFLGNDLYAVCIR